VLVNVESQKSGGAYFGKGDAIYVGLHFWVGRRTSCRHTRPQEELLLFVYKIQPRPNSKQATDSSPTSTPHDISIALDVENSTLFYDTHVSRQHSHPCM